MEVLGILGNMCFSQKDPRSGELGVVSWGGQGVGGKAIPLALTYIAGQVLLALGVCQGHGARRQDVAGGFHLFPGLLVQVLWGLKTFL